MKKLMILLASIVIAMTLNACGGNDDDENGSATRTDIVGIWVENTSFNTNENFCYEFKSNGTVIWRCYNKGAIEQTQAMSYTTSGDFVKFGGVEMYIKTCTSTQLILFNSDGNETFTLTRISSLP